MLATIALVFALVLFVTAGAWNADPWRNRMVCLGLAFWVGAELLRTWK